jgi:hypothetical protein
LKKITELSKNILEDWKQAQSHLLLESPNTGYCWYGVGVMVAWDVIADMKDELK